MKHLFILTLSVFYTMSFAQGNYEEAMKAGLDSMKNIKTLEDFTTCSNHFERVAMVETNEWLPLYYSAYCKVILAFKKQDVAEKQKLLNSAEAQINAALKVAPEEAELYTLQGMLYQAIITIDPMANGQIYSQKATGAFDQAIRLDKENPRPYYLKAVSIMYTPEEYGGGMSVACPLFSEANDYFSKYQSRGEIYPDWGKEDCARYGTECMD